MASCPWTNLSCGETRRAPRNVELTAVLSLSAWPGPPKATRLDKGLTRGYLDGRFGGIPTAGKAGSRGQKEGQPPRRKTCGRGHRAACRVSAEGQTEGGCR